METFADQYAAYGYPVLFVGVLLENAGVPVPGETAVLVAGFLSSPPGGERFDLGWVIALTVVAAVLGDNLGYWLGQRWARPRLQSGKGFLFLNPRTLELAEGYFQRYGLWTIFFARFITGLRVIGALAAGAAGMPWSRFFLANATGALAWATTMSLLGYFFGHSWELLHHWLGRGGVILLGCLVVLIGLPYLLSRLRKMRSDRFDRLARSQVWQGLVVAFLEVVIVAILVMLSQGRFENRVDRAVDSWAAGQESAALDLLAQTSTFAAGLPAMTGLTALSMVWLVRQGRPRREAVCVLWALLASEAVGLVLVGLLHYQRTAPKYVDVWPHGFAALVPLRACAVWGMVSYLMGLQAERWARHIHTVAAVWILLTGFGVLWHGEQRLTEIVLEYAAAGLILFAGIWWLEGFGTGWGKAAEPAPNS